MNDPKDIADEAFTQKAKSLFDESVAGLDGETRSRLNHGRQRALAELEKQRPAWMQWAPAAGVTAAAVLALVIWTGNPVIEEVTPPAMAVDIEILLDEDGLEMLEELEFYSWIDLEEEGLQVPENNVG
jgi:hypothetical protein